VACSGILGNSAGATAISCNNLLIRDPSMMIKRLTPLRAALVMLVSLTMSVHGQDNGRPSTATIIASMKADLKNLVVSEEAYFADYNTYAPRVGREPSAGVAYFIPSQGNVIVIANVSARGWTGAMTNLSLGASVTCGVFVGPPEVAPDTSVTMEGAPGCWGSGLPPEPPPSPETILVTMRTDLRNLVAAQEAYFADNYAYAPVIGDRSGPGVVGFTASGKNVITVSNVSNQGWTGVITNPGLTTGVNICGAYVGPAANAPNTAVTEEGAPACWSR
jgi:hypothetical protein